MKTSSLLFIGTLIVGLFVSSCKKDEETTPTPTPTTTATTGHLNLHFENMVGDSALVFNTKTYYLSNADTLNVTLFKYYISNIVLTNSNGDVYTEPNSYHLIDASDLASCDFTLTNVPFGDYTGIGFMIGVDSAHNVSGAQTGALDPANGMFWSWTTGYIMAKMEGTSPQSPNAGGTFEHHIGGFYGTFSGIRHCNPAFGADMASVSETISPQIQFKTDIEKWFTAINDIQISSSSTVTMTNATSKKIADNYANMISVKHIQN